MAPKSISVAQTYVRTDRRTDGGDCNIPDAFLKKRGDKNAASVSEVLALLSEFELQISTRG